MTPANERKAAERKRKREAGLVPLEVWVPRDRVGDVRAYIASMEPQASKPVTLATISQSWGAADAKMLEAAKETEW